MLHERECENCARFSAQTRALESRLADAMRIDVPENLAYSLMHLLNKHSGGKPFQDVLIIGAGSGNDVAHALRFDVGRVDAVEIDPVIHDIGAQSGTDARSRGAGSSRETDEHRSCPCWGSPR